MKNSLSCEKCLDVVELLKRTFKIINNARCILQANAVMNVAEAKKYYPFFGIGASVGVLVAGQVG